MLDIGLGIRLIIAAAPVPPVLAPPGKPPFPLSSSYLRHRCSSWWFSNVNGNGRDTTTSTTSSSATRRWWSNPEGSQEDYGYSSLELDGNYDHKDEAVFFGFGWAGELFDESWFSKVFKVYGFILPVMLTSMFAATGLKAFLMAMAIPLSQWAILFLLRRRKGNRDDWWMLFFKKNNRWRRPFQEEEYPEDAIDFAAGGRGNGYSSSYYEGKRRRHNYQSWISKDFSDAASTAVGVDGYTKRSSSGDGGGNKSSGGYGGWDDLLDNNTAAAQEAKKPKRSRNSYSQLATLITARNRSLQRLGRKIQIIPPRGGRVELGVGAPPERMRMRQRRMPRTMGLGSTRYKKAPLLMRLLVAVFPFLGSWSRLL